MVTHSTKLQSLKTTAHAVIGVLFLATFFGLVKHHPMVPRKVSPWPIRKIQGQDIFPWHGPVAKVAIIDTGVAHNPFLVTNRITHLSVTTAKSTMVHGTMVAGILVAAGTRATQPLGLILTSHLLAILAGTDSGTSQRDLAQAIIVAVKRGAKVINISMGSITASTSLRRAVVFANRHGVVIVAAAGNNASVTNDYPAQFPSVIAVAAVTQTGTLADHTDYNARHDIAAPGNLIKTTTPRLGKHGQYIGWLSGTSAAAPFVTAACAVLLGIDPSLTPHELKDILYRTAQTHPSSHGLIRIVDVRRAMAVVRGLASELLPPLRFMRPRTWPLERAGWSRPTISKLHGIYVFTSPRE